MGVDDHRRRIFTALFLFAGIGVGALGFLDAQVTLNGRTGRFRSLGGVDLDPVACRSFEKLTKSPALRADLSTMTAEELRAFAGEMLRTLILAATGAFMLSSGSGVWVKRRANGSFPLYLDEQLRKTSKRTRRKARAASVRITSNTYFGASTLCEGRA